MSETEQEATETPPEPQEAPGEPTPEPTPAEPTEPQETPQEGEEEEAADEPEAVAPEQPAGLSEKEIEAIHKKLDAEASRHADRVSTILGEQALDLQPCPLCVPNIPGFIFPMPPPDEVKAKVKEVLGEPVRRKLKKDAYSRQCDVCDGEGDTDTGSRVSGQDNLPCVACKGKGWLPVGDERREFAVKAANGNVEFDATQPMERQTDADPWGRTPDDVDYGRMPMYVRR